MRIISADSMREVDAKTIASGTPGEVLMERAGKAAAEEILKFLYRYPCRHQKRIVILTGKGNNGGDGFVMARYFKEVGRNVFIQMICQPEILKGDALLNYERVKDMESIVVEDGNFSFEKGDVIIDCLLGTGIQSKLKEPFLNAVISINNSGCPVIAVDIPSGLNGNDGEIMLEAVQADLTVSIGAVKTGNVSGPGAYKNGCLRLAEIGFEKSLIDEFDTTGEAFMIQDAAEFLGRSNPQNHKYTAGNVLVIGGSKNYMGAPFLSAAAALKSGAGMVNTIIPDIRGSFSRKYMAPVVTPLSSREGAFGYLAAKEVVNYFSKKCVIAIGPGFCEAPGETEMIKEAAATNYPLIIDAGALTTGIKLKEIQNRTAGVLMTPHEGELKRMAEAVNITAGSSEEIASLIAKTYGLYLILKGRNSRLFCPDGDILINTSGNSGLATCGSGDVLTGMCAAFTASFDCLKKGALTAMFLHGLTSELSPNGIRGTIADDLVELIPSAIKEVSPFA